MMAAAVADLGTAAEAATTAGVLAARLAVEQVRKVVDGTRTAGVPAVQAAAVEVKLGMKAAAW